MAGEGFPAAALFWAALVVRRSRRLEAPPSPATTPQSEERGVSAAAAVIDAVGDRNSADACQDDGRTVAARKKMINAADLTSDSDSEDCRRVGRRSEAEGGVIFM